MINILSILFEYFIAGIVLLLTDNMAVFGVEWWRVLMNALPS